MKKIMGASAGTPYSCLTRAALTVRWYSRGITPFGTTSHFSSGIW